MTNLPPLRQHRAGPLSEFEQRQLLDLQRRAALTPQEHTVEIHARNLRSEQDRLVDLFDNEIAAAIDRVAPAAIAAEGEGWSGTVKIDYIERTERRRTAHVSALALRQHLQAQMQRSKNYLLSRLGDGRPADFRFEDFFGEATRQLMVDMVPEFAKDYAARMDSKR